MIACLAVLAVVVPLIVVSGLWGGPVPLSIASTVAGVALPCAQWQAARRAGLGAPLPSWRINDAVAVLRHSTPAIETVESVR